MPNGSFKSGHDLERAVSALARDGRGPSLEQYYVDRLIARIFSGNPPSFILKGGQALSVRMEHARKTRDIDLVTLDIGLEEAVASIAELARTDVGDYLTYELASKRPISTNVRGRSGYSLVFTPYTDRTRKHAGIHVDLVAEDRPSGVFDIVAPKHSALNGVPRYDLLVTPIASAVADKVCATLEVHAGHGSSRVRDLVDIVTYLTGSTMDGFSFEQRLWEQMDARGIAPVSEFQVPAKWLEGGGPSAAYAKGAEEAHLPDAFRHIQDGLRLAKRCVDPALLGEVGGKYWSDVALDWIDGS